MNDIPLGYIQITAGTVQSGDKIKAPDGWRDAENIGPSLTTASGVMSAVGHPTSLYVCVVRECMDSIKRAIEQEEGK